MKIWLDTALLYLNFSDDCPADCSCDGDWDGFHNYDASTPAYVEEDLAPLWAHTFIRATTLHMQPCGEALWLICDPTKTGKMAVVDREAYALLGYFHSPQRLQSLILYKDANPLVLARGVALFVHLGFLQDLDQPTSVPEPIPTLGVWLHVTNACNLRCSYCYVHKNTERMADDTAKRAVDAVMRSAVKNGYCRVKLAYAGGEAALNVSQVLAMHDYALQQTQKYGLGLSASILSNGVMLLSHAIEQLKQRNIKVMISLDGVGECHDQQRPFVNGKGSFAFVDRTITRLLTHHLIPDINVTVTHRNLDNLPKLIAYLLQRELPFGLSYYRDNECSSHLSDLQFTDDQMISGMRKVFSYIEHHLPAMYLLNSLVDKAKMNTPHQYACGVGRNYLAIDQYGGVAKCQVEITKTITSIDADDPLKVIRENRAGVQPISIDNKEGCRICEWRYWCSGRCPMLTYRLTGRSDIKSPNCAIYKALFPEAVRLEALRLLKYKEPIVL